MKNTLIFIIAITFAGAGGYLLQQQLNPKTDTQNINAALGNQRPEFAAIDLDGRLRNIKDWDGQLIMLNFWATWCPPCLKEIPAFIELQQDYGAQGLQVVGIAVDEDKAVRDFVDDIGINYPIMAVQAEAVMLSKRYGNGYGTLPYTVFIDRHGVITNTISGELSKIRAKEILESHGIKL